MRPLYKITLFFISLALSGLINATFIKVSNSGTALQDSVEAWSCVLDVRTQLMWEVKLKAQGLQDSKSTYTWFDGKSGEENGEYSHYCYQAQNCNTQAFISALNAINLCQSSNWRLPAEGELNSLLVYNDDNPLINTRYFPNTQSGLYWSSTEQTNYLDSAIAVPFFYGGTRGNGKSFDGFVRGVSNVVK